MIWFSEIWVQNLDFVLISVLFGVFDLLSSSL